VAFTTVALLILLSSGTIRNPDNSTLSGERFEQILTLPVKEQFPESSWLTTDKKQGVFALVEEGIPSRLLVGESDFPGVKKIAGLFQKDLQYVSGNEVEVINRADQASGNMVIIGTVGKSMEIDQLVKSGKIDLSGLEGKREQFFIIPVRKPVKGVKNGLVIAGSDKRGTIYGMFELSKQMGVSPWYWWADAPVKSRENIFVKPGIHTEGEPKVKYRGIFINDEDPALGDWAREKFGGFNYQFYEKVFELILRMKGNFLWPAMWGKSLWDDDSLSAPLADELGVVLSTSHHEPMMRSHVEWNRYGSGAWNYDSNAEELRRFWREGMERAKGQEKVVTIAMRGDGDEAMGEDTNIDLLEKIVHDQRKIIEDVTGKPAEEIPQVWALYKEVQDYFDKGMRVPDDVTLLLCDDNWGHVRILPSPEASPRKGGYGMYYHFDFVGGPRSYKWLNTVQIERVWEQMRLTWEYGVREIWLVNVGDLKPMELPIQFFLDYAWNPEKIKAGDLPGYYTSWADAQFGGAFSNEIGDILARYTKYNARRKPELLDPSTYSLDYFNEAERVVREYQFLEKEAREIMEKLPGEVQDAYFQLVFYPVEVCANLNEMYVAAAKNRRYCAQMRASANQYAERVKELFFRDQELTRQYHTFAEGKWNHIMKQTHIGYTTWSDPPVNKMSEVSYIQVPATAGMGYELEDGVTNSGWNRGRLYSPSFSPFDPVNDQEYYIEIFNRGSEVLHYHLEPDKDWINISSESGTVKFDEKIFVRVNWDKVPEGEKYGEIVISGSSGRNYTVQVPLCDNMPDQAAGFSERNGIVSIDAVYFQKSNETGRVSWEVIPNLGRTGSAVTAIPVTTPRQTPGRNSPYLEYEFFLPDSGTFSLEALFSPTLNFQKDEGLLYAFSMDDEPPRLVNLHEDAQAPDWTYPGWWNSAVTHNIMRQTVMTKHLEPGNHKIRYYLVDPGLVLQKIVLRKDGITANSYLGPPQSNFAD